MAKSIKAGQTHFSRKVVAAAITTVITSGLFHSSVQASGFQLVEHGARGQGNAFAGAAATANEASTVWFNPAGMTKLKYNQLSSAGHLISPNSSFTNEGSVLADGMTPLTGANDDGGSLAFVGNAYWVTALDDTTKFGFGVTTPFGLTTEYDDDSIGRYHAVRTSLKTINFNPSIGHEINDKLSVGGGINILFADVNLTNAIDFGSLLGSPQGADGFVDLEGDNFNINNISYGLNLGMTYDFSKSTRIGLAWRSEVKVDVEGEADFSVPVAAAALLATGVFQDTNLNATVTLPQSFSVSFKQDVNNVTLLADVTWTGWSSFQELRVNFENPVQPDAATTEDWSDTYRFSIGADYALNNTLTLRSGLAYDQTPIPNDQRRTARIPGSDRTWISFGATYRMSEAIIMDIGYSHLFFSDSEINNTFESMQPSLNATLNGAFEASVDILSAQLTWNYDL